MHGIKDATTDANQIRLWWKQWPHSNIAIATGFSSGLFVLDVDPRHGGDRSLKKLLRGKRLFVTAIILVMVASLTYAFLNQVPATYHARVTVLDLQHHPVDDAKVVTTAGNEALKVSGGYQIDISADKKPENGKVTFIATEPGTFYQGEASLVLNSDRNPQVTIILATDTDKVTVGGIVEDNNHNGLSDALVGVVGGNETVTTGSGGGFSILAHAPVGKQVLLHAEKKGFTSTDQYHPAGDGNAVLVLKPLPERRRRP